MYLKDKNLIKYREELDKISAPHQCILQRSGIFEINLLNEMDANSILKKIQLSNLAQDVRKIETSKYDFNHFDFSKGTVQPKKYFTIRGILKEISEQNVDEDYAERYKLIQKIRDFGKNYNFDRYSDQELFRIAQRLENEYSQIEDEYDEIDSYVDDNRILTCDKCGSRLNDSGECPLCDLGDDSSLDEAVEKHDTLNPKLWNEDNTLKPEVEEKINAIVDDFLKALEDDEIKINVKDIKLVGSNCSYNYNDKSDLDIHIEADTDSLGCPDNLYPLLYSAYRSIWNKKHDISFYGIPVELFVETSDTKKEDPAEVELKEINDDMKNEGWQYTTENHWTNFSIYDLNDDELITCAISDKRFDYFKHRDDIKNYNLKTELVDINGNVVVTGKVKDILKFVNDYHICTPFKRYIESLKEARQQTALKSNGIYSVMNHKWIKEPVAEDIPEVDQEAFDKEFTRWENRYFKILENPSISEIDKFIQDIYNLRKTSIADIGEYGIGNLVFKECRAMGYLDNLKEIKYQLINRDLSLESLNY